MSVGRVSLVVAWVLSGTLTARADIAAPDPLPVRLAGADAALVGTVTEFEKKTVTTTRVPTDKQAVEFQVMVVKVQDNLRGLKGETHVRVGFIPTSGKRLNEIPTPTVNSRAVFFLKKHHQEDFYVAQPYWDIIIENKQGGFEQQVKSLKDMSKILENPEKGLESKNAEERFTAAALLVIANRGGLRGAPRVGKEEPIDAKQSKLILLALRDADWNKPFTSLQVTAPYLFARLNLTKADGWNPPPFKSQAEYVAAAKKWLGANADTYRIKRVAR
ncbi:MAG: hypothetical protein AB7K24_07205 [Gemmataceae bacterium]